MKAKKKKLTIKRKNSGANLYFNQDTQNAIEAFQKTSSDDEKNLLYKTVILPSFDKLVENLIFMHGFNKSGEQFEILKNDCLTFLYETIYKFDASRGTKAFSYFNVVARNWLIIRSKQKAKINRRNLSLDDHESLTAAQKHVIENHIVVPSQDDVMIERLKNQEILFLLEEIKKKIITPNEVMCMDAIIKVFEHIDDLEFLNKRAIFVYIRDLSSLNSKQMSLAMSQIRKHYRELSKSDLFMLE